MVVNEFFESRPVFTLKEFTDFLEGKGSDNEWTKRNLLAYHKKSGRIIGVKRGLYAVVPLGVEPDKFLPDPFLLATRMADDAVLSYHTALDFYGSSYSVFNRFIYLCSSAMHPFRWRGYEFRAAPVPQAIRGKKTESFGIKQEDRRGQLIRVTGLERTLVDVFDRPDLGGDWEEIWRSLDMVAYFNLDEVVKYALLLKNSTTIAKVGFYLEQNRERLMVRDSHLNRLRKHRPTTPRRMERSGTKPGKFVAAWNLAVPQSVYEKTWEEVL
jgi:predicted transcriptional regulator of viral defense system